MPWHRLVVPSPRRIGSVRLPLVVACIALLSPLAREARADGEEHSSDRVVPARATAASHLSLTEAVQLTRTRGYDLAVAQSQVRIAEAQVGVAAARPNPILGGGPSRRIDCWSGCPDNTAWGAYAQLSDEGLVEGAITRKRALREDAAKRFVDVAKLERVDAERLLVARTKAQYVQTAAAGARLDFAKEVAASLAKAVEVNRVRYPRVIDEGQLARVEMEALKAEQEVERAQRNLRQEQIELATLTASDPALPIEVDRDALTFRVPELLAKADKADLTRIAMDTRPDRKALAARDQAAEASIASLRRDRIPDVSLVAQYQNLGSGDNAPQPPTLSLGLSLPLPLFYRKQGEIGRAEAERSALGAVRKKLDNAVAAEIESSWNDLVTARAIVQRYETSLLERAKRAREITQVQFNAGSATLTDLLDAQRSFVAVNSDYYTELVNYWNAVFLLEQAVGKEIVP